MRRKCLAVLLVIALGGCIGRSELTDERRVRCVRETFAFREATRSVVGTARTLVEARDKEFVYLGVFDESGAVAKRIASFRIGPDRRLWQQDLVTTDWHVVAVCD
jgi:hypothetical protein